ncbi:MAG: tetratricopeptide repeat protein [Pyrinomonadaceae bacterium]
MKLATTIRTAASAAFLLSAVAILPADIFGQTEAGGRPDSAPATVDSTVKRKVRTVSKHRAGKKTVPPKKTAADYEKAGDELFDKKDYDDALVAYQSAVRLNPRQLKSLYRIGWLHNEFGEYALALTALAKANAVDPNQAVVHLETGYANSRLKKNTEAIAAFNRAIAINPKMATAYYELGSLYNDLKRYSEAEAALRNAIANRPDYADAYEELGLSLRRLGRNSEAITAFNRSISLDPTSAASHMGLGDVYFYGNKDYKLAVAAYLNGLRYEPDNIVAAYNVGWGYNTLGNYTEALRWLGNVTKLKPDHVSALLETGYANYKLKQTPASIAAYQSALRYQPSNVTAHTGLGDVYYDNLKDYSLASGYYKKAVDIKADNLTTMYRLGYCYNDLKRYPEAITILERARQLKSDSQPVLVELAYAYKMSGRPDPARQLLQTVIQTNPDNEVAHYYLGQIFIAAGNRSGAMAEYRELQRLKSQYSQRLLDMINR